MKIGLEIRRRRKAMKWTLEELVHQLGMSDTGNLSRIERSLQQPTEEMVEKMAAVFGCSIADLYSEESTRDVPTRGRVPLISWVKAGEWCEAHDPFQPGDAEDWLLCPTRHGPSTFALQVVGDSMDGPGGYREGEIIYVDPDARAENGKDVVARTPGGKVTFKRLKEDGDGRYLLALNPAWPDRIIRVPDDTVICGVVIGSFVPR